MRRGALSAIAHLYVVWVVCVVLVVLNWGKVFCCVFLPGNFKDIGLADYACHNASQGRVLHNILLEIVFPFQCLEPVLGLPPELLILFALGVKRPMVECLAYGFPLFEEGNRGFGEIS